MKNYIIILFLTITGNVLYGQNNALSFDGTDDYVEIANNTILGSSTMTLETWVNPGVSGTGGIFSIEGVVNCIVNSNGGVRFFFDGSSGGSINFSAGINDGAWHHLAATNDNGTTSVYVDGDLVGTQTETVGLATIATLTRPITIGALSPGSGPGSFFEGLIDDVRVWDDVRTDSEIQNNICGLTNPGAEPNLIAYYDFNQTSGLTLTDSGTSGFNGALTNMSGTEWTVSSCPLSSVSNVFPKVSTKLTEDYPLEMPNLTPYPIYAFADVTPVWAATLTNVEFWIDGTTLITPVQEDGYYVAWWTPSSYGSFDVHIKATASNGNTTTDTVTINVVNSASDVNVQTFDSDLINYPVRVFNGSYTFPQSIGAYDQIIANFSVTCPAIANACDDWDRKAYVEYKAPDGTWMELFRYITPYGVPCSHSIDVTDYASLLQGKTELRMFIDTWGSGGWLLHLDLDYIQGAPDYLYSTVKEAWHGNYKFGVAPNLQPCDTISVDFPTNTQKATFRVTTTGHGWGNDNTGNAAEFYHAIHNFHINGTSTFTQDLWNVCNPNPDNCTGQMGTWQYPRAGWCPGIIAPPNVYDLTSQISSAPFDFSYVFQQSYQDLNPAGSDPNYQIGGYVISFSNSPISTGIFGLEEESSLDSELFPNPTTSGRFQITLSPDFNEATVVTVHDISGKTLKTYYFDDSSKLNNNTFDVSSFTSGIYFVQIKSVSQTTSHKLIIQ